MKAYRSSLMASPESQALEALLNLLGKAGRQADIKAYCRYHRQRVGMGDITYVCQNCANHGETTACGSAADQAKLKAAKKKEEAAQKAWEQQNH